MQAQFCSPVSTLIRTPLTSLAIITHSFNDRNLILRKTGGEYAKRGREAEGSRLNISFLRKTEGEYAKREREAEACRLNISFLRKTDGEYAK